VIEDFGDLGRAFLETDLAEADRDTVVRNFISGQYENALRVVSFNTAEGWSQDVTEEIAQELRRRCDLQAIDAPSTIQDFIERHEQYDRQQLTLRLVPS
jgi:hypothetical protein